jgi:hypothetical protein
MDFIDLPARSQSFTGPHVIPESSLLAYQPKFARSPLSRSNALATLWALLAVALAQALGVSANPLAPLIPSGSVEQFSTTS